jgi:arylsulfatase A
VDIRCNSTRLLLGFLLVLSVACGGGSQATADPAGRLPNIVFILADDLGYGDVGAFNPDSKAPTPNIDRLANEGMRYTDAHAPGAVCVPSRYGLMTGRHPFRSALRWREGAVIEEGRMTIASLLSREGYATAMIGKWHLGFAGGDDFDYAMPLKGGPVDHGFDHFFGVPASTDIPPYFYLENDQVVAAPTKTIPANSSPGWSPIQGAFWREGPIAPGLKLEEVMPTFTNKAVEWVEDYHKAGVDRPFFLYVAFTAPHTPWLPLGEFEGRSGADMYGDFVAQVDDSVGQIVGALDRSGFRDNTLLFFTSDNGPVWYPEDVERFGHSSTHIFRGMKGDAWEGGHRMPFVVRWPGRVDAGSVSEETICFTGMLATFAEVLGVDLPDDAGEDSFSILPSMLGKSWGESESGATMSLSSGGTLAIRQGDWKLIPALGSGGFSHPRREEPVPGGPEGQLYNLAADPSETTNLWRKEPEVVERLTALIESYKKGGRSRPPTRRTPP